MSTKNIQSALKQLLSNTNFGCVVVPPNTEYTAVTGTPYCKLYFIQNTPTAAELGTRKIENVTGVMQIDLYFPVEQGDGAILDACDTLKQSFGRGDIAEYSDSCVRIGSAGVNGSAITEGGWYKQVFDVAYSSYESGN